MTKKKLEANGSNSAPLKLVALARRSRQGSTYRGLVADAMRPAWAEWRRLAIERFGAEDAEGKLYLLGKDLVRAHRAAVLLSDPEHLPPTLAEKKKRFLAIRDLSRKLAYWLVVSGLDQAYGDSHFFRRPDPRKPDIPISLLDLLEDVEIRAMVCVQELSGIDTTKTIGTKEDLEALRNNKPVAVVRRLQIVSGDDPFLQAPRVEKIEPILRQRATELSEARAARKLRQTVVPVRELSLEETYALEAAILRVREVHFISEAHELLSAQLGGAPKLQLLASAVFKKPIPAARVHSALKHR